MKSAIGCSALILIFAALLRWDLYDGRHAFIALIFGYAYFYGWRRLSNKPVYSGADTIDENTEDFVRMFHDAIWGIVYLFTLLFLWSPYYLEQAQK
jgi:hypothetical protein